MGYIGSDNRACRNPLLAEPTPLVVEPNPLPAESTPNSTKGETEDERVREARTSLLSDVPISTRTRSSHAAKPSFTKIKIQQTAPA